MPSSPEETRLAELQLLVAKGRATEAEIEELTLYDDHPDAAALVVRVDAQKKLGGQWLERVQADKRLAAAESTPFTRSERGLGVALTAGGLLGSVFFPVALAVAGVGIGILAFSVLRVKIQNAGKDPYSGIEK